MHACIYAHNKKTSRQQGGQPANQAARQYHKASAESLSSSTRGIYAIFLKVGEVDALHCPIAPAGGRCCAATVLSYVLVWFEVAFVFYAFNAAKPQRSKISAILTEIN